MKNDKTQCFSMPRLTVILYFFTNGITFGIILSNNTYNFTVFSSAVFIML